MRDVCEPFVWPVRVYWADADAGGVVYHARYLDFFERARTEWLRVLGCEQTELRREEQALMVVSAVSVRYLRPAALDDALQATVSPQALGAASLELRQALWRGDKVLATAEVQVVCVQAGSGRARRWPGDLRQRFETASGEVAASEEMKRGS